MRPALRALIPQYHRIDREWEGQLAFVIGGGGSVLTQNVDLLRGRNIIAINSSYENEKLPVADYLIYHDDNWWREHGKKLQDFPGKIINPTSARKQCPRRLFVKKVFPPGLASDPAMLAMRRTTFTAGINLAVHLGANPIVLLGADGKMSKDKDGKDISHHHRPHRWWRFDKSRWDIHRAELATLVKPLADLGVSVLNASPGSAWDLWPVMTLEQAIAHSDALSRSLAQSTDLQCAGLSDAGRALAQGAEDRAA